MKKLLLNIIICTSLLLPLAAKAQNISWQDIAKFDNLKTTIDKKSNKERVMTPEEVKALVVKELSDRLKKINSSKMIDINNIVIKTDIVIVPLVESNGFPFYTLNIDRNRDIRKELQQQAWKNSFIEQEKRMDKIKENILEYRKNNPIETDNNDISTIRKSSKIVTPPKTIKINQ